MADDATKRCPRCGETKPLALFGRNPRQRLGRAVWCKKCMSEYARLRLATDPEYAEARRARRRHRYAENPEQNRRYQAQVRTRIFDHYGWACACCGSTEQPTIDHMNGDGTAHRTELFGGNSKSPSYRFYLWLIREGFPEGFQTLCLPCNQSKSNTPACRMHRR